MKNIAIFASGNGSNAEAIVRYFADNEDVCVKFVLTDRENAGVHKRMESLGVPLRNFPRDAWRDAREIAALLSNEKIDLIVLAGFLSMIQPPILSVYIGRIVNIHPSLLPLYGGKGMWGHHVHEAVIAAGDKKSGITIHDVNDKVDEGQILFQAECDVLPDDTPDTLAERVHALEHRYYPQVIADMLKKQG